MKPLRDESIPRQRNRVAEKSEPPNDGKLCVTLIQVRYEWDVLNDH